MPRLIPKVAMVSVVGLTMEGFRAPHWWLWSDGPCFTMLRKHGNS